MDGLWQWFWLVVKTFLRRTEPSGNYESGDPHTHTPSVWLPEINVSDRLGVLEGDRVRQQLAQLIGDIGH
jgi:hypothetical protein